MIFYYIVLTLHNIMMFINFLYKIAYRINNSVKNKVFNGYYISYSVCNLQKNIITKYYDYDNILSIYCLYFMSFFMKLKLLPYKNLPYEYSPYLIAIGSLIVNNKQEYFIEEYKSDVVDKDFIYVILNDKIDLTEEFNVFSKYMLSWYIRRSCKEYVQMINLYFNKKLYLNYEIIELKVLKNDEKYEEKIYKATDNLLL